MDEKFKHIIDTPSPVVDAIVDKAMFHTRKDDARRFLYFMDSYICYYLNKGNSELCFPIIRIPSCPDWASLSSWRQHTLTWYVNGVQECALKI